MALLSAGDEGGDAVRRFTIMIVAALGLTGLAVLTGSEATAAPHGIRPPSVQIGYTDSANQRVAYDLTEGVDMPLGAWRDEADRTHLSRVYATFDVSQLIGTRILDGRIVIAEASAADCSKRAIEVWSTRAINKTPSWETAPRASQKLAEILTSTFCPSDFLSFNVAAAVQDAVAHEKRRVTFEIRVPERFEGDLSYGRTLNWFRSVALSVQYNTAPTIDPRHRYNSGFPCTTSVPYRPLSGSGVTLQSLGLDADPNEFTLRYEFAVWPRNNPSARTVLTDDFGRPGRVGTVRIPDGFLLDGQTYSWQVRVGDGVDTSEWTDECSFVADTVRPRNPQVTSSNYPPADSEQDVPLGEPGVFTFSAGDADTAGFEYTWGEPSVPVCSFGPLGELVCPDPFSAPNTVRAATPGGTATVTLNPPGTGPNRLTVHAIDAAGLSSSPVSYEIFVPSEAEPVVTVVGAEPEWGQQVTVRFSTDPAITGTVEYEYRLDSGEAAVVAAGPDGTATIDFLADNENGHRITVRSHSANGWVSPEGSWSVFFFPWPGVRSDIYVQAGEPVGGVGIPGIFTFSRPAGWTEILGYEYAFNGGEFTRVPAGDNGRATITWAPESSDYNYLEVFPIRPDGSRGDHSAFHDFFVA